MHQTPPSFRKNELSERLTRAVTKLIIVTVFWLLTFAQSLHRHRMLMRLVADMNSSTLAAAQY